jgi:hypothetical protein
MKDDVTLTYKLLKLVGRYEISDYLEWDSDIEFRFNINDVFGPGADGIEIETIQDYLLLEQACEWAFEREGISADHLIIVLYACLKRQTLPWDIYLDRIHKYMGKSRNAAQVTTDAQLDILNEFTSKISNQIDNPPEFQDAINKHFWELI